jgi:ornithine cyclodeaminase/alanine dehydrogenase
MKIISFDDIKALDISADDCYNWVSKMILNKGNSLLPPKTHLNLPGNIFCNVMPSIINDIDGNAIGGVKVVTRYPLRKPSLDSKLLLFNADSGEFLALMDGNWITAMRTGAVAAHSVMHFAKTDWNTLGLIGLGNVTRASLLVLLSQTDRPLTIKLLRYKDQAELFIERFKGYPNVSFIIADSIEDCIKGSDVIISGATYFEDDIALDSWFKEGVLVVPVHTRGFTNCDLFFDKVFADDTGHVDHFKNFSKFKYFAEVSDAVTGRAKGRENDKERILAYNIGISIHDIFYAANIYRKFSLDTAAFNRLPDADMRDPEEKFWI